MAPITATIKDLPGTSRNIGSGASVPLDVAIVDGSGNHITTFGGTGGTATADRTTFTAGSTLGTPIEGVYEAVPTTVADSKTGIVGITTNRELKVSVTSGGTSGKQYTEGDTDSGIIGTALMFEGAADTMVAAPGTDANGLLVDVSRVQGTVTVAGTVTSNAGTNLNTSALALDATLAGAIKAEDTAHTTADKGIMALAVRETAATDLSANNADGDYEPLQVDANGKLWVNAGGVTLTVASHAVTNVGTFAVQAAEADGANVTLGAKADAKSTATDTTAISAMSVLKQISASVQAPPSQAVTNAGTFAVQVTEAAGATTIAKAEDAASADGDVGSPALAVRKATPANTSGTDGDYEFLQMSAGRLWASATIDAALPAGANAIGKLAANSGVTIGAVEIAAAQTLATVTNLATIGTSVVPGVSATHLGKAEDAAHSSGDTGVMVLGVRKATAAADLSVGNTDGDYEPFQVDANGNLWTHPYDTVAHGATDAGNGIKIAYKSVASPKGLTLVTAGQRTDVYADVDGIQIVKTGTAYGDLISASQSVTDTTSTAVANFTAVASTRNYITSVTVHNAHASTNGFLKLQDGSGGTTIWVFPLPATGGATHNFDPPLRQPTVATALYFASSASITTIYVSVNGFQSKA